MTEIRFYHLVTQTLEQALPAILQKGMSGGRRVVVRFADEKEVLRFNEFLWTYNPESFLPHGTKKESHSDLQLVYLTDRGENPNNADMLVLCNQNTVPENIVDFTLCCDFIDGLNDEDVQNGRERWTAYKKAGHDITYYQQNESGGWEKKA